MAAMRSIRNRFRVHDAGVVGVALVEPAERDAAERGLQVVGVSEPVDRDEAQSPQEDRLVRDLLHDPALERGLGLVCEIEKSKSHDNASNVRFRIRRTIALSLRL